MSISLPTEAETVRCAEFALANEIDPGGTALAPDVVVLIEVPEPWPKPAGKHPLMVELVKQALDHPENVRLLAAIPHDPSNPRAISFRPAPGGMMRAEAELGETPGEALSDTLSGPAEPVLLDETAARTMLVCTQGSHDVCCGTLGVEFADWLADERPDVELFRVSHTGGHRFAPTAMTLPDGRMWAYLDQAVAQGVLDRTLDTVEAASYCRGWWGASTGPAQFAERAAFSALGWDIDKKTRSTTVGEIGQDGARIVSLTLDDELWQIEVLPGRMVPTIKCEAPGGQPVKPGKEWTLGAVTSPSKT